MFSFSEFTGINKKANEVTARGRNRPMLNEWLFNNSSRNETFGFNSILRKKRLLWRWFKDQPELSSPVTIRVNDTIGPVDFYSPDGTSLGRNKQIQVNKFWEENNISERLKSIWFDAIITGEGFGWKGFLGSEQIKEAINEFVEDMGISTKEHSQITELLIKDAIDEERRMPRVFDHVASSTMDVEHDDIEIYRYMQSVGQENVPFLPSEIVHFKFQDVDGKVNGHSPVVSLHREILLLWFLKENMVSYIRNGGNPNKLFILPDEQANSKNHIFLQDLLTDFNAVENRNGNLVLTGNVDVKDMENRLRDMEYKEMALWVTSNIAYALQMPVTRIPYLIGKAQSGGDSGGIGDSGYWSLIESDQRKIESLMNSQVFSKMGVRMKFRKKYKLDELRETQALTMKADAVIKLQKIYGSYGKQLSVDKVNAMMDFLSSDVEDAISASTIIENPLENQNLLNNNQLDADNQARRDAKRQEQNNSAASPANDPTGGI